jgi:hypothetical protein
VIDAAVGVEVAVAGTLGGELVACVCAALELPTGAASVAPPHPTSTAKMLETVPAASAGLTGDDATASLCGGSEDGPSRRIAIPATPRSAARDAQTIVGASVSRAWSGPQQDSSPPAFDELVAQTHVTTFSVGLPELDLIWNELVESPVFRD